MDFCPQTFTRFSVGIRLLIRAGVIEADFKRNFTNYIQIFLNICFRRSVTDTFAIIQIVIRNLLPEVTQQLFTPGFT